MQAHKIIFQSFLILSAILLLAVLSWRPLKPSARMRKPSAAVAKPAGKLPGIPQTLENHPKPLAHPKVTIQAQAAATAPAASARRIVVSLEDRRLALIEDGQVKQVFAVAVGKDSTPSPTGTFTIVKRVENPTYYHDGQVVAPGPGNPVGTRWMGLSKAGYGIHGTNAPRSIGKAASHGCIRMARPDLEQLFAEVRTGDTVEIVGVRDEETVALFGAPAVPANPVAPAAAPVVVAQSAPQPAAVTVAPTAVATAAMPLSR